MTPGAGPWESFFKLVLKCNLTIGHFRENDGVVQHPPPGQKLLFGGPEPALSPGRTKMRGAADLICLIGV